ncbi:DUF551 domain-containing protein [Pseudomonas kurunegalensis]|uniref:DUF551 domain-containing protein n=1 Tax=Pseudomonas kurunegalensis TaxID=485880 RepID=UPI001CDC5F04|nr:DUF551 domain-containing protein [Pseudomonas kurunegalensis]MCA4076448.1 DUF551 domain-containing protein [Pseudomonas kurunegalensis]
MSGWIKCSDRLPAPGVIVVGSGHLYGKSENGRWVEPTIFADGEFHGLGVDDDGDVAPDFDTTMRPTHWQPLPSPPTK